MESNDTKNTNDDQNQQKEKEDKSKTSLNLANHQPKYVWKYTTKHDMLPFNKFNQ